MLSSVSKFRWLFFLLGIIPSIGLQAQAAFTLAPTLSFSNEFDPMTGEITAHIDIQNETTKALAIIWERQKNDLPSNWESYICSDITCSPPEVAQDIFSIDVGQSINLDCHFVPNETGGQAEVQLKLYLREDTAQQVIATYQADNGIVSIQEITETPIQIFPNPVTGDYVTISAKTPFERVVIYSILGQQMVNTSISANQQLDIGHLPSGLYLLYTFRPDGQQQKAVLLQKT